MNDPNLARDPQAMFAKLEQLRSEAEETLRQFEEFRNALTNSAVEAVSQDGLVTVRLDADGQVAAIDIHDAALRHRSGLARIIRATIEEATATYAIKAAELVQPMTANLDVTEFVSQLMPTDLRDKARDNVER